MSFSYDSDQQILNDISFDIKANTTLAIVGRSGAGKSTFLDLLLGLIKPTGGVIMYGDIPHTDLDYRDLRSKVAYVGQDTTLFSGTLEENLCFVSGPVARDRLQLVVTWLGLANLLRVLIMASDGYWRKWHSPIWRVAATGGPCKSLVAKLRVL